MGKRKRERKKMQRLVNGRFKTGPPARSSLSRALLSTMHQAACSIDHVVRYLPWPGRRRRSASAHRDNQGSEVPPPAARSIAKTPSRARSSSSHRPFPLWLALVHTAAHGSTPPTPSREVCDNTHLSRRPLAPRRRFEGGHGQQGPARHRDTGRPGLLAWKLAPLL